MGFLGHIYFNPNFLLLVLYFLIPKINLIFKPIFFNPKFFSYKNFWPFLNNSLLILFFYDTNKQTLKDNIPADSEVRDIPEEAETFINLYTKTIYQNYGLHHL